MTSFDLDMYTRFSELLDTYVDGRAGASLLQWSTADLDELASIINAELQDRIHETRDADARWLDGIEDEEAPY